MPLAAAKSKFGKISNSKILTPPHPWGMWCQWSVNNLQMNLQSKFGNCSTFFGSKTEIRTIKRTNKWTIWLLIQCSMTNTSENMSKIKFVCDRWTDEWVLMLPAFTKAPGTIIRIILHRTWLLALILMWPCTGASWDRWAGFSMLRLAKTSSPKMDLAYRLAAMNPQSPDNACNEMYNAYWLIKL